MGWNGIGWFVAAGLGAAGTAITFLWPTFREFGYFLLVVAIACGLATMWGSYTISLPHVRAVLKRLGAMKMLLLVGIIGTWIFGTLALGTGAWLATHERPGQIVGAPISGINEGPLTWIESFTSLEGGMSGMNVFSLRFQGANTSKEAIELRSAVLTSLVDGTRQNLEIVGTDTGGAQRIVSLDRVHWIPPGAAIELVAKFGPVDPVKSGNVLGLEPKAFLEKWRQFAFDVTDSKRSYHFEVKETSFMAFFQGKVGPRVAIKE